VSKIYFLDDRDPPWFPDPSLSSREGIIAISETLGTERLILAYQMGIFPWLKTGEYPVWHWFSPDPRFLLFPEKLPNFSKSEESLKGKNIQNSNKSEFSNSYGIMCCSQKAGSRKYMD
jgi:leucyl/phenylalanyl-tRNA--protein transferase